ncbi:hypothetical protein [Caballeronia sp. S22]|uniref:hypothetical protein n=1 Tax=Caballeronia sp. S22 TaxID=3137182 RepID=UPI0035309C4F
MTNEQILNLVPSVWHDTIKGDFLISFARALLAASESEGQVRHEVRDFQRELANYFEDVGDPHGAVMIRNFAHLSSEGQTDGTVRDRARWFVRDFSRDVGFAMSDAQQEIMLNLFLRYAAPIAPSADSRDADGPAITADVHANAARYQWLKERFTGYDFDWMPSEPDADDGKSVAVFNVGREFRGGRDVTAAIDAAIAAQRCADGKEGA